jgi:hypothetical protein
MCSDLCVVICSDLDVLGVCCMLCCVMSTSLLLVLVTTMTYIHCSAITSSPFVTAAVFAASCGPLAWSVLLLGNALVSDICCIYMFIILI